MCPSGTYLRANSEWKVEAGGSLSLTDLSGFKEKPCLNPTYVHRAWFLAYCDKHQYQKQLREEGVYLA